MKLTCLAALPIALMLGAAPAMATPSPVEDDGGVTTIIVAAQPQDSATPAPAYPVCTATLQDECRNPSGH